MPRKRYSPEQTITELRQAEVELSRGGVKPRSAPAADLQEAVVSEQTHYRWRKEYGGLRLDQAKRLKTLEQENARLKRLVADQALDNAILKAVAAGNFCARRDDARPWIMYDTTWTSRNGGPVGYWISRGQPVELELHGRLRAGRRAAVIDEDDHPVRSDLGRMQEHHVPLAFAGFSGSEVDGAQNREAGHEKQGRPRTLPKPPFPPDPLVRHPDDAELKFAHEVGARPARVRVAPAGPAARPGFPSCLSRMAPLYTRGAPSGRYSVHPRPRRQHEPAPEVARGRAPGRAGGA